MQVLWLMYTFFECQARIMKSSDISVLCLFRTFNFYHLFPSSSSPSNSHKSFSLKVIPFPILLHSFWEGVQLPPLIANSFKAFPPDSPHLELWTSGYQIYSQHLCPKGRTLLLLENISTPYLKCSNVSSSSGSNVYFPSYL